MSGGPRKITMPVSEVRPLFPPGEGEIQQWFNQYSTLERWLCPMDPESVTVLPEFAFLSWIEIFFASSDKYRWIVDTAPAYNTRPALLWCWMTSEHISQEQLRSLVRESAQYFQQQVGFALVFHPRRICRIVGLCIMAIEMKLDGH